MSTQPSTEELLASLNRSFRNSIPSGSAIASRAVTGALKGHESDIKWIKLNFSRLVEDVQSAAYAEYQVAEQKSGARALIDAFTPLVKNGEAPEEVLALVGQYFISLDRFFLGLTQGRRPRAGKAFELLIRDLFSRLGYPFASQPIINGQPDFVLPSLAHFKKHASDAIIFTVKRTLRERWRQIVTEGTRGLGFYLATIDEEVSARDLKEMLSSRISLVVPERLKAAQLSYRDAPNVFSFEYFFEYHLDPAMARWRASGAIPK